MSGKSYQPALVPLSAKLVKGGMSPGATVNMLRGLMDSSAGPRDERWQIRYDDIPRIVDSATAKNDKAVAALSTLEISYRRCGCSAANADQAHPAGNWNGHHFWPMGCL